MDQDRLKNLAQESHQRIIVSWDNFDYNQTVRHQTLRNPSKHVCATTGKLCIGQCIPDSGLLRSMFHPEIPLDPDDVHLAPGNRIDNVSQECQRFWIAEAISYVHREAVKYIFDTNRGGISSLAYPDFPSVERLAPRRTPHFGLGPILENEGTIEGTYEVIDNIFKQQLKLDDIVDFKDRLFLVYGDQKTVSLIQSVKQERRYSENIYGQYQWLLPIPGLFHWRTNFIDMIYDVYGGCKTDHDSEEPTTLLHKIGRAHV